MSSSFPYTMLRFPPPLDQYSSALMELDVMVSNLQENKAVSLLMIFDTGASISLGPRSVATMLDLDWESGVALPLGGVGGSEFMTRVHPLKATIPLVQAQPLVNGEATPLAWGTLREVLKGIRQNASTRPFLWRKLAEQSEVKFDLPMAIAEGEDFELLLGMLGVIDGIAEFLCDNVNRTFSLKEELTKPYLMPSVAQLRRRLP